MREDVPDVHHLPRIPDYRDEPEFIPPDVEHGEKADAIGMRKVAPDIDQVSPDGSPGHAVPVRQRLQCVPVFTAEQSAA